MLDMGILDIIVMDFLVMVTSLMDLTSAKLSLDTTMVMVTPMFTKIVPTTMVPMDMKLIMNTERGQLMLDMAMVVTATSMLTDPTQITRLRCTILTRCQTEIVPQLFSYSNQSKST